MSERVLIQDIGGHVGQTVTVKGWLYSLTDKGRLQFLWVRDGTGVIQAVAFERDLPPAAFAQIKALTQESSIIVSGVVRADSRAPGGHELSVSDVQVVQRAESYPITPKEHGVDFLMDHRHLWIRTPRQWAILRVRATVIKAIRDYFDGHGFLNMDTPILTPTSCEDQASLFATDFYGQPAYLTQSGQLYNEANIMAFGKVYCFGPTFRAEKSKTRRHLSEFWMVEPEMAYADLDECMRVGEGLVTSIVRTALTERRKELEILERDIAPLERVRPPFPRATYDEAVATLNQKGIPTAWGDDFGSPHETTIAESFDKPVFVHHYPTKNKAFYMEPEPDRPEVCMSADLLAPEGYGEIIGGGQRTASADLIRRRFQEFHLPIESYQWYLDLRLYGSVPHSGFGLGVERTVAWVCGLPHIRETVPYPRMMHTLYP